MKKLNTFAIFVLILCIFVFLLTLLDFAALHDIKQDYVSKKILNYLNLTLSDDLPDWTSTTGEWQIVKFSFYLRFIFFIVNIILLALIIYHRGLRG